MSRGAATVIADVASAIGGRARNEDFAAAVLGEDASQGVAAALADGIGGAKGGRVAAEVAVRGFLDGLADVPETMEVRRAGAKLLDSLNGWIHAQGRNDPDLAGMGCTFTGLVLRGRIAHLLHVGDSRAYRLSGSRLTRLTTDHVRASGNGGAVLTRALGIEAELRLDYASQPMALHDRFLLCSDGVHGPLDDEAIAEILRGRSAPRECGGTLVAAALAAGGTDNATALVMDVIALPSARPGDVGGAIRSLPLIEAPRGGETIDRFTLKAMVSDGAYSRLFSATDEEEGGIVVLKFPKAAVAAQAAIHAAFVREAWVGRHVSSPWLARAIELPHGRQSCLYTVMPLYEGELLETRLGRSPGIGLEEGRGIAIKLARAAAALHRVDIIHRDIKPDNVILEAAGSLKLIDLGVVRLPGLEDEAPAAIPGTIAYVAPEMLAGDAGSVATDIYALGVTMFRAFSGEYPYGNATATSPPHLQRPRDLSLLRPDLPTWLHAALGRAIAHDPAARPRDMAAFADELEAGPTHAPPPRPRPRTLYERSPILVWQAISALLALALLASLTL